MNNEPKWAKLTIKTGQTKSAVIALTDFLVDGQQGTNENKYFTPKGVLFPITTGTSFSFEVSRNGSDFVPLRDAENNAISITKTAAEASAHPLMANDFAAWSHLKIVSGSAEAADRDIHLAGYEV